MDDSAVRSIKERVDVAAFIGRYVHLTKAGKHYKGCCPFHEEKTPSFVVSPELGIFKCFGCGKAGDIFTFLQEAEGMPFGDALQMLARETGVVLPERKGTTPKAETDPLKAVVAAAAEVYRYLLLNHAAAEPARTYLHERGIHAETSERFLLGYAPPSGKVVTNYLLKKGYAESLLMSAGVSMRTERGEVRDRFRNRVVFPLREVDGSVIGFMGRTLAASDRIPKYLNSPETPLFKKSSYLYGLYEQRGDIKRLGRVFVVEGPMDVVIPVQEGISPVIATLGTAFSPQHVHRLIRMTQSFYLCFDSDSAGFSAARRAAQVIHRSGGHTHIVLLPDGKDPDEVAREAGAFQRCIEDAPAFLDHLMSVLAPAVDFSSPTSVSRFLTDISGDIAAISDAVVQSQYVDRLAQLCALPREVVLTRLAGKSGEYPPAAASFVPTTATSARSQSPADYYFALLLHLPLAQWDDILPRVEPTLFADAHHQALQLHLRTGYGTLTQLAHFRDQIEEESLKERFDAYALWELPYSEPATLLREVEKTLIRLRKEGIKRALAQLSREIRIAEATGDLIARETLEQQVAQLTEHIHT